MRYGGTKWTPKSDARGPHTHGYGSRTLPEELLTSPGENVIVRHSMYGLAACTDFWRFWG